MRKHKEATKNKMRLNQLGNNNSNWKGGKPLCPNCGMRLTTHHSKRCRACYLKSEDHLRVKEINRKRFSKEKNPNWAGGIHPLALTIRQLPQAEEWRNKIFIKDDYTCQECSKKGVYVEAHHIKPFSVIYKEFLQEYSQFSPIEDKETLVR